MTGIFGPHFAFVHYGGDALAPRQVQSYVRTCHSCFAILYSVWCRVRYKLKNKAYVTNAPKEIVQNDKNLVKELTIEDEKLRSIVSSIN